MRTHSRLPWRLVVIVVVSLGLVGCGSDDSDDAAVPAPPDDAVDLTGQSEVTVVVGDNKYTERIVLVSPGTDVTWVKEGLNRHNVIPSVPDSFMAVETADLDDGGSAARTFDTAGEYAYYCSIHGTIDAGQRGWVYVAPEAG